jgi:hypothetical protein
LFETHDQCAVAQRGKFLWSENGSASQGVCAFEVRFAGFNHQPDRTCDFGGGLAGKEGNRGQTS